MKTKTITHSLKIEVFLQKEDKEKYLPIINSIKKYRIIGRQIATACAMAEIAGASIKEFTNKKTGEKEISVKPDTNAAKKILVDTFDKDGKAHLYQLRNFVRKEEAPEFKSFVWDSIRADVSSKWLAKDPEFSNAKRGWLLLQTARTITWFHHIGIGFPLLTANPKIENHVITLFWDTNIGPVNFIIPPLDSSSYYIYKCIREKIEGWKPGTIFLNERDRRLHILLTYSCPVKKENIDKHKKLFVEFTNQINAFITMYGERAFKGNIISAEEAIGWLLELKKIQECYDNRKKAAGNPNKPWGFKIAYRAMKQRISNLTNRRKNGEKDRNHVWTRRIVDAAVRNECGTVIVKNIPSGELFGEPWGWYQFKNFLEYKMNEVGGKVEYA